MLDRQQVGRRIAELRDQRRMTQPHVASLLDVSLRQYQRWEAGDSLPYWETLDALAGIFEVEVDELLSGQERQLDLEAKLDSCERMLKRILELLDPDLS